MTGLVLIILAAFALAFGSAQAQRPFGDRLERAGLKPGVPLPDVTVYDASGSPFSLRDLKGSYTVLVLGCLT